MSVIDWGTLLTRANYDATTGLYIAKLLTHEGTSSFLTRIDPGKKINPHYHRHGDEHYHILEGSGEIRLHNLRNGSHETRIVTARSSFAIPPLIEHALSNTGTTPLLLMFSCPDAHLGEDRFIR